MLSTMRAMGFGIVDVLFVILLDVKRAGDSGFDRHGA
jgi:hypothetical protein